jgi:hypothetical protein
METHTRQQLHDLIWSGPMRGMRSRRLLDMTKALRYRRLAPVCANRFAKY